MLCEMTPICITHLYLTLNVLSCFIFFYFTACGLSHTLILTEEGVLYSCGNNEVGQLGQENGLTRPSM